MKLLITGFQPFGGENMNPAYEAVKRLPDRIGSVELVKKEIPVVFGEAARQVIDCMEELQPDVVICVGQAGGRPGITPEKVAINLQTTRMPDNAGNSPVDLPICPEGPDAYFSLLPVRRMEETMTAAGLPAYLSYTAGTYVCNDVMYRLLHHITTRRPGVIGGFIHVPFCKEQVEGKPEIPAMELEDIVKGLILCVETLEVL
ncbi:MAG: pyroglutamyl-peptidase I [Lachnospiraceae bacterium]|nr:pyroglutamyl-peptidase I [Lachnospiraceae bacterium]